MEHGGTVFNVRIGETVNAYALGDFHEGNANVDYPALKKSVAKIAADQKPKVVFIMGDWIEAILPDDKRWNPTTVYREYALRDLKNLPNIQVDNICKILEPIKDDVVAILIGNHEEKYIQRHFSDVYERIGGIFPKAVKLGGCGFYRITLRLPDLQAVKAFDFSLKHGNSGGNTGKLMGYPINKVRDSFEFELADFCIIGHLHKLEAKRVRYRMLNHTGDDIVERKMWYGCSGTFKRTYVMGNSDWFEQRGREEADIGYLKMSMTINRHHVNDKKRSYTYDTTMDRIFMD